MSTLYRHGFVYSPADPFATAMLVSDGQVAWVGSDEAAAGHADSADAVVDLDGALVTPAFVDAHAHLSQTGLARRGVDLSGTASLAEGLDRVEQAARASRGRPVYAHSFDEDRWVERRPPTGQELDRAGYGGSVYLVRVDGHSAVVSSALAAAAKLSGWPGWHSSGLVLGEAHHAAREAFAAARTAAQRRADIRDALAAAAAAGIGLVHEQAGPHLSSRDDLADVLAAGAGGAAPATLGYWAELAHDADHAARLLTETGARGLAGDLNVDGSLGSRTASLRAPYADGPGRGAAYLSAEQVRDHVVACTRAGVQGGFHVIGDAGVDTAVAGLRAAAKALGAPAVRACRHRLEHVEMADAQAVATLADLGVVASVQPVFDARWGGEEGMYAARLGPRRALAMNPFADLAAAGVLLALGSDAPVTPFAPWAAVRACVNHHDPAQRISARSAFLAHTRGGWRAAGVDDRGYLAPGQPATFAVWAVRDLVVQAPDERIRTWSTDPRSGTPGLPDLSPGAPAPTCLQTVVGGRTVYQRHGTGP